MAGLFGSSKTINNTENKIGALRIQNSSQGLPIPIVIGKTRLTSNLLWYGDFTAIPHTESQSSGGKGGGGVTTDTTTYTYTVGSVFGLMEGPSIQANFIQSIWSNKDFYDSSNLSLLGLSEFQGTYVQTPWSYLTTNHANEALAYRGTVYAATGAFDLGGSDGLPNLSFEVVGFLGSTDQNTANVTSLLLTADKFGAGWPSAHLGSLTEFSAYCAAAGFLISPALVAQTQMSSLLTALMQIGNTAVYWSDDLLKFKPYADTAVGSYTPDLTVQYHLGYSDFMPDPGVDPVVLDRKRQADAYNSVKIECLDRGNQYNPYVAEAKDQWAIDTYGLRPMEQITAHAICDPAVARTVAQTILQRVLYVRNVYKFKVGWRYGRLEPMDIVGITDAKLGLADQAVRIISIEEDGEGYLSIEAEELTIGVSTPGSYSTQGSSGSTPQSAVPPGNATAPVMFQPPLALTGGSPQLWLGTAGGQNWGGAEIWASQSGSSYQRIGIVTAPARFGTLTANFALGSDPDTTNSLAVNLNASNGVLTSAANAVADAGGTLSYVSGANAAALELIDYTTANLTSAFNYTLGGYLRRAQFGTVSSAHASGSQFMRLDGAVAAVDVPTSLFGTMIYVKLLSFNTVGGAKQDLADVSPYTFNVVAQIITDGSGYPFYADTSSTANTPASGHVRWNNASQANATSLYFSETSSAGANLTTYLTSVGSLGFIDLRDPQDANKWASYKIVSGSSANGVHTFGITLQANGVAFPNNEPITASFNPTVPNGLGSVGLNMPAAIFSVANSPLTSNGTIAVTFNGGANGQVPTWSANGVVWANQSASSQSNLTINPQTANYTLAAGDFNVPTSVVVNSSSNLVLTVPSNANLSLANGSSVVFTRQGNGTLTVSSQANVTVHNTSSNTLRAQYSPGALVKVGTDEWNLFGDLT